MSFSAESSLHLGPSAEGVSTVVRDIRATLSGEIDLVIVFFSNEYVEGGLVDSLVQELQDELAPRVMMGCQGESIVGRGVEVEEGPALSVWAAQLPGVPLQAMSLEFERTPDGGMISGWPDAFVESWPSDLSLVMLADPFSFPADHLAAQLAENHPDCTLVGGMASGASTPNQLHLFVDGKIKRAGAVAVALAPPAKIRTVVSQGCRPIGEPMVVTKAERNLILELGGKPALQQLDAMFRALPNHEQALAQRGLHIGRVINEYQESFEAGDFLIRNVMGIDPESDAVATSDYYRVGQTVQFHLRDQESATRELHDLLQGAAADGDSPGGLLFTCNGRGTRMFEDPNHDATAVGKHFPKMPLAGFFAQGEIGPVGGQSFIHGFTACLVLLQDVSQADPKEP